MDMQLTYRGVCVDEPLYNDSVEQAIDCEFTLPDYCPDIQKILKCTLVPKINSCLVSNNLITVDGTAYITLLYCSKEQGELRGYEVPVSFSKNLDTKSDCSGANVSATIKTDYVNCRAVNERKLDIHGAATLHLSVTKCMEKDAVSDSTCSDIQIRKTTMPICETIGCRTKQFTVHEELELGQSNGSLLNIIKYDAEAVFDSCKTVTNKAVVKGSLCIRLLYLSEDQRYEKAQTEFPLNQIVELDGLTEDAATFVKMDVCACELKPYTNADGECRSIMISVKVNITVCGSNAREEQLVTDAYCTRYALEPTKEKLLIRQSIEDASCTFNVKSNLQINCGVGDIIDIWCMVVNSSFSYENGELVCRGTVNAGVLATDASGSCSYYEKPFDFEHRRQMQHPFSESDLTLRAENCSYSISSDETVEMRCDLQLSGTTSYLQQTNLITDLTLHEDQPKQLGDLPAMTLYFANAGESVWDIAVRYNTAADVIMEQNKLTGDVLTADKMLLIPSIV